MRLIDADALIADIRKNSESYFADDFAREWVDRQPAIDAVPVVRCRECANWETDWTPNGGGEKHFCPLIGLTRPPDWYCADGERKEENGCGNV